MDLRELMGWRPKIETVLDRQLKSALVRSRRESPLLVPYLEAVREFNMRGGKRFRALLLLAGYHLAGGRDLRVPLPAAAALETFQGWMLAHDDVIDHGETRRGGPTLHVAMAARHDKLGWAGADADFGAGIAITLGDLLEPLTVEGLLACRVPPARTLAVLDEYRRMTEMTAYGQLLDITNGVRPVAQVTAKDVLTVHRLKSAVYTVTAPLRMGAILGGASPGLLKTLAAVGDPFGIAFQLRDDILGVGTSAVDEVGKSTNDLFEGKRTLLVVHAWKAGGRDARSALGRVLGNPLASPEQFEAALDTLEETGSFERSEAEIARLREGAFKVLDRAALSSDRRALLREIGTMLTERQA